MSFSCEIRSNTNSEKEVKNLFTYGENFFLNQSSNNNTYHHNNNKAHARQVCAVMHSVSFSQYSSTEFFFYSFRGSVKGRGETQTHTWHTCTAVFNHPI